MALEVSAKQDGDRGEKKSKGEWDKPAEFTLTVIGYTVGIGNIWRFPYLCARNGGVAFLVPYVFFVLLCGYPLMFLEFYMGQFSSLSPPKVWKVCPLFQGLGYGLTVTSILNNVYFIIIITWIFYYLAESFKSRLPWASCDNSWNTATCVSTLQDQLNITTRNVTDDLNGYNFNVSTAELPQLSRMLGTHLTSTAEFWQYRALDISTGFGDLGIVNWRLLLALAACWLIVFLVHIRGIKSSGKVVYVTALAPYFFLTVFLIRGLLLPGATEGILYFITPDLHRLLDYRVWVEACLQVFYSLGATFGGLITMASYNKFCNNFHRDALIVTAVDTFTSFYAGLVLYTILGFMAHKAQISLSQLSTYGPGLLFVVYPEIFSQLPFPQLWSVLFFIMLLMVGFDSQFVVFENMVTGLADWFPNQLRQRRTLLTGCLALLFFLLGIVYVTQGGMFLLQITDWYISTVSPFIVGILECVVISWIYGYTRLESDVRLMLGRGPSGFIRLSLAFTTPLIMLVVFLFIITMYKAPSYGNYNYPRESSVLGWCIGFATFIPFPIVVSYRLINQTGPILQRIKTQVKPNHEWEAVLRNYGNNQPLTADAKKTINKI